MNTQVADKQNIDHTLPSERGEVAIFTPPRLPYHEAIKERYDITRGGWKVLCEAIFPLAKNPDSVILALAYCKERNLDVMKKPVHIVPMWNSNVKNEDNTWGRYVDTIWPSIAELRTTAFRTGEYAGKDETAFGPMIEQTFSGRVQEWENRQKVWRDREFTVRFPEWAQITLYRMIQRQRCQFVGPKVYWLEAYATIGKTDLPNEMWQTRSIGQIDKCAEAASLRCTFPEELGGMYAAEEMEGRRIYSDAAAAARDVSPPRTAAIAGPPKSVPSSQPPKETPPAAPADETVHEGEIIDEKPRTMSGPPRHVPEKKQEAQPQASGAMPNPEQDTEGFFGWLEGKIAACKNADQVMLVWTDEIHDKIPVDLYDDANAVMQNYLNKFE